MIAFFFRGTDIGFNKTQIHARTQSKKEKQTCKDAIIKSVVLVSL